MTAASQAADLFDQAEQLGELSNDSVTLLDPLQTEINAALATGQKKRAAKVVLVSTNLDNSTSMEYRFRDAKKNPRNQSNWEIACEGHDRVFGALVGCKAAKQIMVQSTFLIPWGTNNGLHFGFRDLVLPAHTAKTPAPNFLALDPKSVKMHGFTPQCTAMLRTLGAVQAQATDYTKDGSEVFTITIFLGDGGNNDMDHFPAEVCTLVTDMRRQERHKIYFGGIEDGSTDYHAFGAECGLDPECVKTLPNDPHEIRAWLDQVSQSAVAGSEAADINSFSQVKL